VIPVRKAAWTRPTCEKISGDSNQERDIRMACLCLPRPVAAQVVSGLLEKTSLLPAFLSQKSGRKRLQPLQGVVGCLPEAKA
jgi:hypothetical protein